MPRYLHTFPTRRSSDLQVGYMVMGLGIYTPLAVAGAIFYIVHHMIVKTALFLFAGAAERVTGTTDLKKMGGLLKTHPALDRKSTRLNSSHVAISYAVFC